MLLTHFDESDRARMSDVGEKAVTKRIAVARGRIVMQPSTLSLLDGSGKKGNVLNTATVAGILAAKRTSEVIPMCHPIATEHVALDFTTLPDGVEITATVSCSAKTGVEMEALYAVTVAGLTIYDMLKSADKTMRLEAVRLLRKTGGKSGDVINEEETR